MQKRERNDPNLSCKHTLQTISDVYTAQDCDDRLQCAKCVFRHNRFHSSFLMPLKDFSTYSPKTRVEKVMSIIQEQCDYKSVMCEHFTKVLNEISKKFEGLVLGQKQALHPPKLIEDEDVVNLNRICDDLIGLRKECFPQTDNKKFSLNKLHDYIGKYVEFERKVSGIEETINLNPIRSFSYKELQSQIDEFAGLIDHALNRFKDIYFLESERSDGRQDEKILKELAKPSKLNGKEKLQPLHFDMKHIERELTLDLPGSVGWNSIESVESRQVVVIGDSQGNISCWNMNTWECFETIKYHDLQISCIKYSKKLDSILTASDDATIKVLKMGRKMPSISMFEEGAVLKEHKDKVWSLLVIEGFDVFYSSGKEAMIIGWDLNSLTLKHKIDTRGRDTTGTEMVFIPSLKLLAVSFKQGTISFYDIETPLEIRSINTYQKWIHCMRYLEERDQFVIGADIGTLKVWKVGDHSFQQLQGFNISGGLPLSFEYLSNSQDILIGSDFEKLVLLNLDTGKYALSSNLDLKKMLEQFECFYTLEKF